MTGLTERSERAGMWDERRDEEWRRGPAQAAIGVGGELTARSPCGKGRLDCPYTFRYTGREREGSGNCHLDQALRGKWIYCEITISDVLVN